MVVRWKLLFYSKLQQCVCGFSLQCRICGSNFLSISVLVGIIVFGISSCTVEKQYHSAGYRVSWNSEFTSANKPADSRINPQNSNLSKKSPKRASFLQVLPVLNDTSKVDSWILAKYRKMDVPMDYLLDYGNQILLKPYFRHDSIVQKHKLVSVYTRDKVFVGKLMGISESGVFILNNKKSISLFENLPSSKDQKRIMGKLCYIPYNEINAIQKGGTFLHKLQILLQPFFQWVSLLIVLILSFVALLLAARATAGSGGSASGDGFKAAFLLFLVIAVAVAAVCTFIIGMLLAPPVWIIHQLFWGIPGRYWSIKGDSYRGEQFFKSMMKSPRKLKIIRRRFLRV